MLKQQSLLTPSKIKQPTNKPLAKLLLQPRRKKPYQTIRQSINQTINKPNNHSSKHLIKIIIQKQIN